LEKIAPLSRFVSSAEGRVSINRRMSLTEGTRARNETENLRVSPSLILRWANGLNATLSGNYTSRRVGTAGNETRTNSMGVSLTFKHSMRGGKTLKFPLFGKGKKLKGNLDTTLDISYDRTGGERRSRFLPEPEPLPKTTKLKVSPRLTYSFSARLRGSVFLGYNRSYNESTNQTITAISVGINAVFTF